MIRCNWIETTLNIRPETLSPCCAIHLGAVPQFKMEEGKNNIVNYKCFVANLYQGLQEKESQYCKRCDQTTNDVPYLFSPDSLIFKRILINIHENFCNCKCIYCTIKTSMTPPPSGHLEKLLLQLEESNSINQKTVFDWGGGESTIFKDFYKFAPILAEKGYCQHVFSNGIAYSPVISDLLSKDKIKITISLDSHDRDSFLRMKRVDKFEKVIKNIQNYLKSSYDKRSVIIKYIITDDNNDLDSIKKFLYLCRDMGVQVVLASPDFNKAKAISVSIKTEEAAKFMFRQAKKMKSFYWCGSFYSDTFSDLATDIFRSVR